MPTSHQTQRQRPSHETRKRDRWGQDSAYQVADCKAADTLLDALPKTALFHGDKGCDSNAVRRNIDSKGTVPNIPPMATCR